MSPLAVALIVVAVIVIILLAALLISSLTKKNDDPLANQPGHDHSKGGAAGCPACQAASKPVPAKIPLKCMVQFRPLDSWKGEYGFDWLRIAGAGEKAGETAYKDLVDGGAKTTGTDASGKTIVTAQYSHTIVPPETVSTEDYAALKKQYNTIPVEIKSAPDDAKEYFVPYLNLFPEKTPGTPTPPSEAELKIIIAVEQDEPDKIELEYDQEDKNIFKLTYNFTDKAKGSKRKSPDTLKITCSKETSSDQEIRVMAYPKGWKSKSDASLVGKLIVGRNDSTGRKQINFVFVKVWSDSIGSGAKVKGSYTATEKTNLTNALFQALISGEFEDGPDLDLSGNDDFKKTTAAGTMGKFYNTNPAKPGLFEDHPDFFTTVRSLFLGQAGNNKYNSYFTVFAFGERPYDKALGQAQAIGSRNLIIFPNRDDCTTNHEVLHGLGLHHSFKQTPLPSEEKFTFKEGKTDNVMDYTYDSSALITWRWQWKLINK
jgi:hypothetical protein